MPGFVTAIESTFPFTMFGLNSAPLPSGSLHVNCALTDASVLTFVPFFLINTPRICPISSTMGSALIGLVDFRLSHTISGKHGFLFKMLLLQLTAALEILPEES